MFVTTYYLLPQITLYMVGPTHSSVQSQWPLAGWIFLERSLDLRIPPHPTQRIVRTQCNSSFVKTSEIWTV
jgi:hypothetical protein